MSKFIIVIVSALLAILAINNSQTIKENWMGSPSLSAYVSQEVRDPKTGQSFSLSKNMRNILGDNDYPTVTYPNLQGALSPRFVNSDLGSAIKYNLPDSKNMAANVQNALTYNNYVQNQCGGKGSRAVAYNVFTEDYVPSCQKAGLSNNNTIEHLDDYINDGTSGPVPTEIPTETPYPTETSDPTETPYSGPASALQSSQSGTKMSALAQQMNDVFYQNNIMSALPVSGMNNNTLSQSGESILQPVLYDRYMFSNQKSKLQNLGDPIRGDLAIIPNDKGWFQPSVNPSVDLNQGAMNVLAGNDNRNAQALADLIYDTSGRTITSIAGADIKKSLQKRAVMRSMQTAKARSAMMGTQASVDIGPISDGSPVYATTFP